MVWGPENLINTSMVVAILQQVFKRKRKNILKDQPSFQMVYF